MDTKEILRKGAAVLLKSHFTASEEMMLNYALEIQRESGVIAPWVVEGEYCPVYDSTCFDEPDPDTLNSVGPFELVWSYLGYAMYRHTSTGEWQQLCMEECLNDHALVQIGQDILVIGFRTKKGYYIKA